ncbi:hypothetical protein ILUMI_15702 [Ignelater luminosus]|uniref:Reverse transcriptase domain-containing protein n=1 Tax=Ignelater luminosus TaxID=2038154 RepID=A0A8K0CSJ1_IGNLU|nr:hypothetical protein ILUMI_15702 [Ignelater luminosus]
MIRYNKEQYLQNTVRNVQGKKLWKRLKNLLPHKKVTTKQHVLFNSVIETDEKQIAQKFNVYFVQSIEEIRSNIMANDNIQYILDNIETKGNFETFEIVTMEKIRKIIKSLKVTIELDTLSTTNIVRDCFEVIGNRFLEVLNTSLQKGIFPEQLKTAYVTPVPKIVNSSKCEDSRPINTVSIFEKIFEAEVKDQIVRFCDENEVLVENQSGFRKGHSCEAVILNVCDEWFW